MIGLKDVDLSIPVKIIIIKKTTKILFLSIPLLSTKQYPSN